MDRTGRPGVDAHGQLDRNHQPFHHMGPAVVLPLVSGLRVLWNACGQVCMLALRSQSSCPRAVVGHMHMWDPLPVDAPPPEPLLGSAASHLGLCLRALHMWAGSTAQAPSPPSCHVASGLCPPAGGCAGPQGTGPVLNFLVSSCMSSFQ